MLWRNGQRLPLGLLIIVVCSWWLAACSADAPEAVRDDKRPNIIYILADDLGYGDIGAFGQTRIKTPHLDQLAREGMRFTQHYAGSTVCAPSRASLVTGVHPGRVRIRGNYELGTFLNEEEWGQMPLRPGTVTIGTVMRDAGYQTALIGKWGLGGPGSYGTPNKQGFQYFFGYLDQKQAHNHYPTHLWRNEERFPLDNAFMIPHQELAADADVNDPATYAPYRREDFAQERLTQDALRYIREHRQQPFFLYLSYAVPHAALQVPEAELAQYAHFDETPHRGGYLPHPKPRAARAAMITYMDRDIGKIKTLLEELGLARDTLVMFSSDNGPGPEGGADMEFFDSNGPLRGYKRDLYEGGIKTPTIAWWPGKVAPGSVSDHLSAFWDVLPTLADLAGVQTPEHTDGISMLPTLLGREGQRRHDYLYWEFHRNGGGHAQAVRFNSGADQWKAVRRYTRKQRVDPPVELYDLVSDGGETTDLSERYPDLAARAVALMDGARTRSEIDKWNFDYWPETGP